MPGNALETYWRSWTVALVVAVLCSLPTQAEVLLFPDDLALRSDIQLLSDAGLLSGPTTGWPLSVSVLIDEMQSVPVPAQYQGYIREAWYRVMTRLQQSRRFELGLAAIDEPVDIRRFSDTPRGSGVRAGYQTEMAGVSLRLNFQLQESAAKDSQQARLDGTVVGVRLGNWLLSAGLQQRWWGPGYESSLILSTNARPVPALGFDTLKPIRFKTPWLSWLGAMDWRIFAGKLEGSRFIADAKLLGARLSLRPTQKIEIGLSRTAQWGGRGRPQDFGNFFNLLIGRDNRGDAGITLADEPGNQLGGVDLRWLTPIGDAPYAVYLQLIGEDEAGGLPSRMIGLGGGEYWRSFHNGTLRVYAEAAETTIEFYKSAARKNLAYEHFIYRDGYRYRGRAIGHAMDNDSLMVALGAVWSGQTATWEGVLRRIDVNPDGGGSHSLTTQGQDRWEMWLASGTDWLDGELSLGLVVQYINPVSAATKIEPTVYARWERSWGQPLR